MTSTLSPLQPASTRPRPSLANHISYRFRRHWFSSLAGAIALAVVIAGGATILLSDQVRWNVFFEYLTADAILEGAWLTVQLTVISMAVGTMIAFVLAAMRESPSRILQAIAVMYMWFFRGTPLLVQLIFWFNIALFVPEVFGVPTNSLISGWGAAVLGCTLNVAAYQAEIIRAGLLAVDHGQTEAGLAIGMKPRTVLARIVIPQAARVMVPPTSNQFIDMLKATSLASAIGTGELMTVVQAIYSRNYAVIELLFVACAWYLVMTTIAVTVQWLLERRLSRSVVGRGMAQR